MVVRFLFFILFLYELSDIVESSDMKNGLTSMIDNTASMTNDMEKVKIDANAIFKTVMNTNTSQIEDFVLVTFRDPGHCATFFGISLYNPDCPEMSMSGIQLALQKSQKGSFLFVFTDASAKDYDKYEEVEALAQKKGSQVVFVLTGICYNNRTRTDCLVYHKLAKATNGQVFHLKSQEIGEILKYVENSMESRKNVIASKKFPPGYGHSFEIDIDVDTKELVISVSGEKPSIGVTNSTGASLTTTDITRLDEVAIVKAGVKPGVYKVEVGSKSETHVVVSGSTSVHFQHGFSIVTPSAISDTVTRPVPEEKSHLSIKLSTEGRNVTPSTVQILDMDDNLILKQHLNLIDKKEQFYTTDTIIPPDRMFKIAIKGYDANSKTYLTRMSLTPVKPQDSIPGKVKSPVVTIDGSPNIHAEYDTPLQLKCRVSGFPKPIVTWRSDDKVLLTEKLTTVELPYDYISVLDISGVRNNTKYSCKAVNSAGNSETYVAVQTIIPGFFVVELPKDTTIEYKKSGQIQCKVNATVSWYKGRHSLKTDGNLELSDDGSILTIRSMEPYMDDEYMCEIRNAEKRKFVPFTVKMTGVDSPKISKDTYYINTIKDFPVDIQCQITKGKPRPAIHWLYKNVKSSEFVSVAETTDTIHFDKVKITDAGAYKCIANNVIGEDYHETELIVEYKPVISRMFKPRVTKNEGEMVTLKCIADGIPSPDITWKHNGAVIRSSRHTFFKDGRLKFPTLLSDGGIYECEARNANGADSIDIQLVITVPVEIESPKSSSIEKEVGSEVTLPCRAYGVPAPWIRWGYRKNPKAKPLFFKTRDPKLWFPRIQPRHSGQYFCIATNSFSSKRIEYEVSVMAPPSIRYTKKQFHGVVGDMQLRIPCVATGNPKPDITWTNKDGNIASGTKWFNVGEDGSLVVKNVTKFSEGFYTCTASNRLGEKKESFDVIVDEYPKATANPKSVMLEEGKSSEIIPCSVTHRKTDKLSWFKDGQIVSSSKLILPIVRLNYSGTYTCRVSSVDRPANSGSTNVEVGFKPRFSNDTSTMNEIPFVEGGNTVMDCTATGKPKPQIKWLHDGKEIDGPARYEFVMTNTKNKGRYICEVSNKFGSVQKEFNILSFEPPSILPTEKQFHGVVGDMQLRISCVATGYPKPDITWSNKDGNIASGTERFDVGEDDSLVIKNIADYSKGNYTCTASNRLGVEKKSFEVIVDKYPKASANPKSLMLEEGNSSVIIPCSVPHRDTDRLLWYKDGQIVSSSKLKLPIVKLHGSGTYTCRVSSVDGPANSGSTNVEVGFKPRFSNDTSTMKEIPFVEGRNTVMDCTATGKPKPQIKWLHDGIEIDGPARYEFVMTDTKYKGRYICEVSNKFGSVQRDFNILSFEPPSILPTEKQFHGVAGAMQLRIPCVATGYPKPDITWSNEDGNIVSGTERFDVGEDGSLVIKNVTIFSEGNYTCTASNILGTKKESFDVIVDESPSIRYTEKLFHGVVGDMQLRIPCVATGNPKPDITWSNKDGNIAPGTESFDVGEDDSLVIKNIAEYSKGNYTCTASNRLGVEKKSFEVIVDKYSKATNNPKSVTLEEGNSSEIIPCSVPHRETDNLLWFKDGQIVSSSKLKLPIVRLNDSGTYTCRVSSVDRPAESGSTNVEVGFKPRFSNDTSTMKEISFVEGGNIVMDCTATGEPKPQIKWLHDGKEIDGPARYELVMTNTKNKGRYICEVSNKFGSVQKEFNILSFEPPSILSTEKQFHGVVDDMQLRIPCVATGYPKPNITWTNKDGNIASGTERFDVEEDGSLVIKNVTKFSEGNYTCTASNILGEKKASFDVIVDEYAKATDNPKSVMLEEGNSSVIIPCSVSHRETDRLLWFKDGQIVSSSELKLPIVRLNDSGTYTCRVSSVDRPGKSGSTNVEVGLKPRFSYDTMKEIPFVEGGNTVMDCTATGKPKPQIKWLHDGKEIDKPARYEFVMTNPKDRGRYICEVSNKFGSVQKEFNILSFDYCLLDLKKDFNGNEPLMLTPDGDYASFETSHGYLRIPKRTVVKLVCPSTFKTINSSEINVTCEKEQLFKRSSIDYAYSDLKCNDKLRPSLIRTGNRCKNDTGELFTVGFKTDRQFWEIYKLCIDESNNNNPIYTILTMQPTLANVTADKDIEWFHNGSPIDLDSMYNCSYQNKEFSLVLHRDGCCFARRMLVNPKDVAYGLPQHASYTHLNIVPHWSTCSSKNWEKMEQQIRNMVKSKNRPLQVWTGTAQTVQLPDDRSELKNLTLNSAGKEYQIPKYLWKVIQDERSEASLAIIQVNVPDLKSSEALAYMLCTDICRYVSWLRGRWRSSKHGFIYCCGLTDFERAFGYSGVFKNYPKKLLN